MDRGTQALITSIVFTVLSGIFIILRVISKFMVLKRPGPEDYLIVIAFLFSIALTVNVALQNDNGLGSHAGDLPLSKIEMTLKLLYMSIVVYNLGLFMIKTSILVQYLRIFAARNWRIAAWTLMGLIWAGGLTFVFISAFSCTPVKKFWDADDSVGGHCIVTQPLWYSYAGFQLLTDFAVLGLPIPVLVKLQIPKRQKYTLIFVFLLGGFACIVSILRLHGLYAASKSQDLTYDNATAVTWSTVELNTGIICACFPALRPIVSSLFPRLLSTAGRTTAGQSNTFPAESRSRAYYQRHDSTIELSKTAIEPTTHSTTADGGSGDEISFDTATKEPGIHVTSEWRVERSTSTTDDGESGVLGRAV